MIGVLFTVIQSLFGAFRPRGDLLLENLALRHQLTVLTRNAKQPRFSNPDRLLWIFLKRIWSRWKGALVSLQPQTVVGWHRAGFRLFWRWKSKREGRPPIDHELIGLIRRMWEANPTWGSPRIRAELAKLGLTVGKAAPGVSNENPPASIGFRAGVVDGWAAEARGIIGFTAKSRGELQNGGRFYAGG